MRIIAAVFLALAMSGCAMVESSIAIFHELPVRAEPIKYAALPFKEQEGSLEYGSSGQVAAVMPTMIKALFEDFPGKSGSTRKVFLPIER